MASERTGEALTYGTYLCVPELLSLQRPLSDPPVHDEMLFIILQQAQELWFKQVLFELHTLVELLEQRELLEARWLLDRVNKILHVLCEEVEVMETLSPREFKRFRGVLKSSSGFESIQFRELELACGLTDEQFLKLASHYVDMGAFRVEWPKSVREAFHEVLYDVAPDPVAVLVEVYRDPDAHPDLYLLAEGLSEYEVRFSEWRFHHVKLVERVIGDRSPGTGGSPGGPYLTRTLSYRFFPELWEARNLLASAQG